MLRLLCLLVFTMTLTVSAQAQEAEPSDRSATGGAQTLEDIMKRQEGLKLDDSFRSGVTGSPDNAAPISDQLGTLGGASDPDLWRAYRYNSAAITTQARGPAVDVLIQDGGMRWLLFREGPLLTYGMGSLGVMVVLLVLFYLIRGKIRIDGEKTGQTILRFKSAERFAHWLLAGSFILLGITGIITLAGRKFFIPLFGHEAFATVAVASKWIHNNVAWAFILALVLVFVFWVVHNLPDRADINWILKGGGILGGGHPPAKKFNAGQKFIFWSVIILGGSIAASGLSLLFPFELPMFAATFDKLNALGLPQLVGLGELNTALAPHEEMQYAQLWHAIVSFVLMVIVIAHIYIGSVGMEGAYDAMGKGEVELQWAREHHSIWTAEVEKAKSEASST
ncbi:formate dehydrogenase subunit gamma [uncultured Roseobacter sp.]|uniref:formate dehydrogenase subunit gamma n=1 Tax=uncultured Roseobacter sp. TaxID=114847 RepID=UPI002611AEC8|nr:formate dehydrogenase subunit gamma [uncultured Roseobacter sp.]